MIYSAEKEDALSIAKIHKQEIGKGFLSSLPIGFLEKIYLSIISKEFCVVAKENNEVVGFVAGTEDIRKLYRNFLKRYFFYSIFVLSPKVFRCHFIKRIFENLFYPKKEVSLPSSELLAIAVKKDFQGRGLAKKMFAGFTQEMRKRKVATFKVVVGEDLVPAIHFYEKSGFTYLKEITIHQGQKSRIYIYKI